MKSIYLVLQSIPYENSKVIHAFHKEESAYNKVHRLNYLDKEHMKNIGIESQQFYYDVQEISMEDEDPEGL